MTQQWTYFLHDTYTHYPAHVVCNLPKIPETMKHI